MKPLKIAARINYLLLFISFFLPFAMNTCIDNQDSGTKHDNKQENIKSSEMIKNDNLAKQITPNDTSKNKYSNMLLPVSKNPQTPGSNLRSSFTRFKHLFFQSENSKTYNAISYAYHDSLPAILYAIPLLCFLLLLVSIFFVFKYKPRYCLLTILSAFNIFLLLVFMTLGPSGKSLLYGFWIMLVLSAISLIVNWWSHRIEKNETPVI